MQGSTNGLNQQVSIITRVPYVHHTGSGVNKIFSLSLIVHVYLRIMRRANREYRPFIHYILGIKHRKKARLTWLKQMVF